MENKIRSSHSLLLECSLRFFFFDVRNIIASDTKSREVTFLICIPRLVQIVHAKLRKVRIYDVIRRLQRMEENGSGN